MKRLIVGIIGVFAISLPVFCAEEAASATAAAALPEVAAESPSQTFRTNVQEVIKLSQSGVSQDVVLAYISNGRVAYKLNVDDVLKLKDAGLTSEVIAAMLNHDKALQKPAAEAPPLAEKPKSVEILQAPGANVGAQTSAVAAAAQPPASAAPSTTTVVVQQAPPPTRIEIVPISPGPDYYWVDGYWGWRGSGWVWFGGNWDYRPGFRVGVRIGPGLFPGPRFGPGPGRWGHGR